MCTEIYTLIGRVGLERKQNQGNPAAKRPLDNLVRNMVGMRHCEDIEGVIQTFVYEMENK